MKHIVIGIIAMIMLLNPIIVTAENPKYQIGMMFLSESHVLMVTDYDSINDVYTLTSSKGIIKLSGSVVDAWTPIPSEATTSQIARRLNLGAIINGEIRPTIYGDINGNDFYVETADVYMINDAYSGKYTLNQYQLVAADVNGDGKFSVTDVLIMADAAYIKGQTATKNPSKIGMTINNVPGVLNTISISPDASTGKVGDTVQYTAVGMDYAGTKVDTPITWSISNSDVGKISDSGLLTITNIGQTCMTTQQTCYMSNNVIVKARSGVVTGTSLLTISGTIASNPSYTPAPTQIPLNPVTTVAGTQYICSNNQVVTNPKDCPTPTSPGFEIIYPISGLVIVAYIILKQNKVKK